MFSWTNSLEPSLTKTIPSLANFVDKLDNLSCKFFVNDLFKKAFVPAFCDSFLAAKIDELTILFIPNLPRVPSNHPVLVFKGPVAAYQTAMFCEAEEAKASASAFVKPACFAESKVCL